MAPYAIHCRLRGQVDETLHDTFAEVLLAAEIAEASVVSDGEILTVDLRVEGSAMESLLGTAPSNPVIVVEQFDQRSEDTMEQTISADTEGPETTQQAVPQDVSADADFEAEENMPGEDSGKEIEQKDLNEDVEVKEETEQRDLGEDVEVKEETEQRDFCEDEEIVENEITEESDMALGEESATDGAVPACVTPEVQRPESQKTKTDQTTERKESQNSGDSIFYSGRIHAANRFKLEMTFTQNADTVSRCLVELSENLSSLNGPESDASSPSFITCSASDVCK